MVGESFSSGEALALARQRVGLSQVALAARLGLHVAIIADWEQGKRAIPLAAHAPLARIVQAARLAQATAEQAARAKQAARVERAQRSSDEKEQGSL